MLPTRYLKRVWFWLGMGTGALALVGLIAWLWRTRPHGPNIQPVQIDFNFIRHPAGEPHKKTEPVVPAAPAEAAREIMAAVQLTEAAPEAVPDTGPEPTPAAAAPDDLTALVGIGPRIAAVLSDAGVTTFAQLAQADPAWLREMLLSQNLRLADPESWPEQARLAVAGKWDEIRLFSPRRRSPPGAE